MEYKRPDGGWKIYREARFTEFSNYRLGVFTLNAHENSNQSLNIYIHSSALHVIFKHPTGRLYSRKKDSILK